MKLKSYIFQIALAAVGAGFLGSCEDMLEPTSDYVIYENGSPGRYCHFSDRYYL